MTSSNTRVLVVDDEEGFTKLLRFNLERTGNFDVREVTEPSRALSTAREFQPDVILLDIVMPKLDGGEVAALLKEDPALKDTPVLFLTALVDAPESGDAGIGHPDGNTYITKTVSVPELIRSILGHVEASRARKGTQPLQ